MRTWKNSKKSGKGEVKISYDVCFLILADRIDPKSYVSWLMVMAILV